MNKRFFIFSAAILAFAGMSAQTSGIDAVLQQIEANNKELQANSHLISSQKLENKTNNNLPDPTLSYAHLWDSKNSDATVGEMVISQSFDFPTLYARRTVEECGGTVGHVHPAFGNGRCQCTGNQQD